MLREKLDIFRFFEVLKRKLEEVDRNDSNRNRDKKRAESPLVKIWLFLRLMMSEDYQMVYEDYQMLSAESNVSASILLHNGKCRSKFYGMD